MVRILSQEDGVWTITPSLLWVIVSLAAIFFVSGIIHLLLKFFTKKQTYHPSVTHSNRFSEFHRPQSLGRQLQQLFRLQDSGLDQSFIDKLPVFDYKDINKGLQDPFDCAVCLCEFSPHDKLRLIPICSHAFHTHCIDTWLLSNSTCPLCRVNLSIENPLCNRNRNRPMENLINVSTESTIVSENCCNQKNIGKRVLSVRLGKLKSLNEGDQRSNGREISRCNLDARRCFSMGSFQYVVNNIDLEVALKNVKDNNMDERKIKHESFSVSKVWLWSKKGKFPVSSSENIHVEGVGVSSSQNKDITYTKSASNLQ